MDVWLWASIKDCIVLYCIVLYCCCVSGQCEWPVDAAQWAGAVSTRLLSAVGREEQVAEEAARRLRVKEVSVGHRDQTTSAPRRSRTA